MVRMSAFGVGNAYKLRSVSVSVFSTPISIEPDLDPISDLHILLIIYIF